MKLLINKVILVCLLLPFGAAAQTTAETAAAPESRVSPCEQDERFREFDFWVGEWDVHDGEGTRVQIWHAAGGYQIDIRGGLTDNGMLLRGTIHYIGTGQTAPFRGLWTPLPDGRVRQFFEQSNDDGETWEPWFEGFYTRKSAD